MKAKYTWVSILAALLVVITTFFAACKKDEVNGVVNYRGQVVYLNTTTPFPDLTVKVTDGRNTHCQTQTDAGGLFVLQVRVDEIDGNYYLLAGDSTCVQKKVALGGYGQAEVDLGTIEVEGPTLPTVVTNPVQTATANSATLGGDVQSDGRLTVTARGICYGTNPYPTLDGLHTNDGTGKGPFTTTLKELQFKTTYYARAYATNRMGTAYGEQVKFITEEGVAVVVTDSVYRITAHAAKCKGHVVSDGGFAVTKRGTCWSKRPDPTVDDDCSDDGSGKGEFTSTLKELMENTTYYVRTYATNSTKTTYGEQIIITTLDGLAVVKTDSVSAITATGFTAYGTVVSDCDIPVTARGFCYSTRQYPTIEDKSIAVSKGLGTFRGTITGLDYATTYYVRAFATNATATVYGDQIEVTTLSGLPTVTTKEVTNIGSVKATCGGNVTSDGSLAVTARGVCYGTDPQPTLENTFTTDGKGTGEFTSNLKNLQDKTTYYVRAYATTDAGTAYGEQRSFKTENGIPVVVLNEVGEPTANSVSCTANVTGDGGLTVTERGLCYGVSQYPTNTDTHIAIGNGIGEFTGSLTGLTINTTYYVRAYAVNSIGVGYSEQKSFTTKDGLATVTTTEATSTAVSITAGGQVSDDGGYAISERGICYSATNAEPSITDDKVVSGKGKGSFNLTITELTAGTIYHLRAYATNENGTAYGNAVDIQTKDGNATIVTGDISNITSIAATASVTVSDAGGATLQSCGICWSTNSNPTISDSKAVASGKQLNSAYTCNLTELQPNTTYYVRGYATTDITTAYGEQKSFTTKDGAASVVIGTIANITALSASTTVTVTETGGATLQSCGICWSTNSNPTISDSKTVASGKQLNSAYTCNLTELQPNTTYYVRGYATTDIATAYGEQKTFTTKDGAAAVSMGTIADITALSASTTLTVTDAGGSTLQSCGICWSTQPNPTVSDSKVEAGGKQLNTPYTCNLSNLSANTMYYVRAYATTNVATAYSDQKSFRTVDGLPIVTTGTTTATATQITANGTISSDGGYSITARGVCYSTSNSVPTIADAYTTSGIGTGTFSTIITSVDVSTTYYVRAYATNTIGTGYGDVVIVTTANGLPSVVTTVIGENVTQNTAISGGQVTDDGGYTVTARGVCWNTLPYPTISDNKTTNGTGTGYFTSTVTGIDLTSSNTYYVRAYATNKNGTTYGEQVLVSKENWEYKNLPSIEYGGYIYRLYPDMGAMTWYEANDACKNLVYGGYDDWMLPETKDLLVHIMTNCKTGWYTSTGYLIDNNPTSSAGYWTQETRSGVTSIYEVYYSYGSVTWNSDSKSSTYRVRPVRKYKANQ